MPEDLEIRVVRLEAGFTAMQSDQADFATAVKDLRDSLVQRPSWPIATAITFLCSMCVGLAVALASGIH